jgi:hypothetical protein
LTPLEENLEKRLEDIYVGRNFMSRRLIAQEVRERIDKWDHIKLKCSEKQRKQYSE